MRSPPAETSNGLAPRAAWLPLLIAAVCLVTAYAWHTATYSRLPDFAQWPEGEARKTAFFAYLGPLLEAENARVLAQRRYLEALAARLTDDSPGWTDRRRLQRLTERYQIDAHGDSPRALIAELLLRVDAVPVSLGLAQAAMESGWGTSRFAVAGNALFGERCFRPGCGVVPQARHPGSRYEVRAFARPEDAVAAYVWNLNTHRDYQTLREHRAALRAADQPVTGFALAQGLGSYSERGDPYVQEVQTLIVSNGLGPVSAE